MRAGGCGGVTMWYGGVCGSVAVKQHAAVTREDLDRRVDRDLSDIVRA